MPSKLVFFAGSPSAQSLKWDERFLLDNFIEPVARFAGLDIEDTSTIPNTLENLPSWRSIPLVRQQLQAGLDRSFNQHEIFQGGWQHQDTTTSFFNTSQISDIITEESQSQHTQEVVPVPSHQSIEEVLTQFYEESYQRHEDILSSQIALASDAGTSFTSDEHSYNSTSLSFDSLARPKGIVPIAGHLSDLGELPNARYLDSIQPQTMTVNLIVGLISVPPARNITTRRGAGVELIEVLVGDETKYGFGVNFWLPSPASQKRTEGDMRSVLEGLRPQDVVLMKNVALSSFKGRVYGQSLRKEMTKVYLLYRNRVDRDDVGGCYSASDLVGDELVILQAEKTRKVREWVMRFVGGGGGGHKKGRVGEVMREVLPPDTQ